MTKIFKFIVFTFLIYTAIIFLIYPNASKAVIYDILDLWLTKVLVCLLPFYLLSNLLLQFPFVSKLMYPLLKNILHFENRKSCSLFLLSFITGNPTSSILVINSVKNNEISVLEGNRLLRCTVLSSPLFVIAMVGKYGGYLLLSEIIVSTIFYLLGYRKHKIHTQNKVNNHFDFFDLAEKTPNIMLEILSSMLIIGLLKIPFENLLMMLKIHDNLFTKYSLDLVELTCGLNNIQNYNVNNVTKVLLSSFLLSFGGITIIIQIMNQIKRTSLSKTSLVMSRILHGICTVIVLWMLIIIFRI